jgi:hypothetical protein
MLVLNFPFRGERIMKKLKFFYLRNQMLVANGIANFIGVFLAIALIRRAEPFPKELFDNPIIYWTDALFDPSLL